MSEEMDGRETSGAMTGVSFDVLIENKTSEIMALYEEKTSKTKCKKMTIFIVAIYVTSVRVKKQTMIYIYRPKNIPATA